MKFFAGSAEVTEEGEIEAASDGDSGGEAEEVEDGLFQCEYCGAAFGDGLCLNSLPLVQH